jgi:hypothetical protein
MGGQKVFRDRVEGGRIPQKRRDRDHGGNAVLKVIGSRVRSREQ